MTENSGTLVSPLYPDTLEGPVLCEWDIEAKNDEIVTLDMNQFKLGIGNNCGRGTLEVRDTKEESLIGSYCGAAIIPRKVRSHSNHMYIKYVTNGAFKGERFKIEYIRGMFLFICE